MSLRSIFFTEVLANAREPRTLASALLLGPLIGPVIFAITTVTTLERATSDAEGARSVGVAVSAGTDAENLERFLKRFGFVLRPTSEPTLASVEDAVRSGERSVGLHFEPDAFGFMRQGEPVPVRLVVDGASPTGRRLHRALEQYGETILRQRLMIRGLSPLLHRPFAIDPVDVSTPESRAELLLSPIIFLLIFTTLLGGAHHALDATAGERERGSLEPLLALPVSRTEIVVGKIAATTAYMLLSTTVALIAFSISLRWIPLDRVDMAASIPISTLLGMLLVMAPFAVLGASLLTVLAAFTRTYREAQTGMGAVLLLPTLPALLAQVSGLEATLPRMAVPALGQQYLLASMLERDPLPLSHFVANGIATTALASLCVAVAVRLYLRERILG